MSHQPTEPVSPKPLGTNAAPATTASIIETPGTPTPLATRKRGIRISTIVWGFLIVAIGVGLIKMANNDRFDITLALIIVLAIAGLTLVVSSVVSSVRRQPKPGS